MSSSGAATMFSSTPPASRPLRRRRAGRWATRPPLRLRCCPAYVSPRRLRVWRRAFPGTHPVWEPKAASRAFMHQWRSGNCAVFSACVASGGFFSHCATWNRYARD